MSETPNWITAISLSVIAAMLLGCAGLVTLTAIMEHQRRDRMLREEPWRHYIKPEHRFDPDAGNW